MKEVEKIVLLRMLRKEREEAEKIVESIKDPETRKIFKDATINAANPKCNVGLLDTIISEEYDCKHEYGLYNPSDSFMSKDCMCLDCGEYLNENEVGILYATSNNMSDVRKSYLELMQQMSICDSVTTIQNEYKLKRCIK